jgi:hypothetical protein
MTEPRTEAGRQLLQDWEDGYDWQSILDGILAIEAEAVAQVRNEMGLVEPDDDRQDYVTVQLTRSTWEELIFREARAVDDLVDPSDLGLRRPRPGE